MEELRSGYKILVADDDPNVHQSLNAYFRREGYQMISAFDGGQALELARRQRPDIVILDIMMPTMDGMMVCRELLTASASSFCVMSFSARAALILRFRAIWITPFVTDIIIKKT